MKSIAVLVVITFVCLTQQTNIFEKIFGKEDVVQEDLNAVKDNAYKTWLAAQEALSDMSNEAWDKLYETYEEAWLKYQEAKQKLADSTRSSFEKASKEYTEAKNAARDATENLEKFLSENKDKVEERTSDAFFAGLDKLVYAEVEARKKYLSARDALQTLYDKIYDSAVEDYNVAAQHLNGAVTRAIYYANKKAPSTVGKTRQKLEEARQKARETYKNSKATYQEIKGKILGFNEETSEYVQTWYEWIQRQGQWFANWLNEYTQDTKAAATDTFESALSNIRRIQERASKELEEAESSMQMIGNRTNKFAVDIFEAVKEKYQNLKDEL